jgi:hypothetical protein
MPDGSAVHPPPLPKGTGADALCAGMAQRLSWLSCEPLAWFHHSRLPPELMALPGCTEGACALRINGFLLDREQLEPVGADLPALRVNRLLLMDRPGIEALVEQVQLLLLASQARRLIEREPVLRLKALLPAGRYEALLDCDTEGFVRPESVPLQIEQYEPWSQSTAWLMFGALFAAGPASLHQRLRLRMPAWLNAGVDHELLPRGRAALEELVFERLVPNSLPEWQWMF